MIKFVFWQKKKSLERLLKIIPHLNVTAAIRKYASAISPMAQNINAEKTEPTWLLNPSGKN